MKIKTNIITLLAAAVLTACQSDDVLTPYYTVEEAVNAITLSAGISEDGSGVQTRAGSEDHHTTPGHKTLSANTKLQLRMDGIWLGKTNVTLTHGTITDGAVTQTTTATVGDAITVGTEDAATHNKVTFTSAEQLYWDDYGSADPANMNPNDGNGRDKGLTIYGAAVDGVGTAPEISSWKEQQWNVGEQNTGKINQSQGWAAKDLLTSNNIQVVDNDKPYATDGTYKFQDFIDDLKNSTSNSKNLLEFTHAMTKITVNLTAGEGFPGYENGATNAKFQNAPTVTLLKFNYKGTVDIEEKKSTPTSNTTADIIMHLAEGGANNNKAKLDALVFPGNTFTATIASDDPDYTPTSETDILELNADGNIYKVTAAQLVKAIAGTTTTGTSVNGTLEQGKNYIFNIIVNKTKIDITATIKAWEDVNTEEAKPKINVTSTYGYAASDEQNQPHAFKQTYDFFRSISKGSSYNKDAYVTWDATNGYVMHDQLYWPNHQTHYFFRGVYPRIGKEASGTSSLTSEAVTTVNSNDVIAVANAQYTADTYPSDLAIAIPRNTDGTLDETCKNAGHTATEGICATEGVINMNFEYAMSKVEIRLKSSATNAGHIDLTKDNTKIEIINGYSQARIKLSDGLHDTYGDSDKSNNYSLNSLSSPESGFLVTTLDAIVPQIIGNDVLFRITYTNDNGTTGDSSDDTSDVYECQVNTISIKNSDPANPVTEWKNGKHYIYELDLNKTTITVTATLKDWITVEASQDVWF